MRETYYQSVGNPLQWDRLPLTRPSLELLAPPRRWTERVWGIVSGLGMAASAAVLVVLSYPPAGIRWLEPFDLVFALPTLAIGVAAALWTSQVRWLLHPLTLTAAVLLCANHRTPWMVQVVMLAHVIGLLAYAFGRHWSVVCTSAPVPRTEADALRAQWQFQLSVVSVVAVVLTASVLLTGSTLLKLAVVLLPVAAFTARPQNTSVSPWQVLSESLGSWFTYHAQPLPGLQQSPVGPTHYRTGLVLTVTVLTVMVFARWSNSPLAQVIELGSANHQTYSRQLDRRQAGDFERLRYGGMVWGATVLGIATLPVVMPLALAFSLVMPILCLATAARNQSRSGNSIETILTDIRRSPDLTERGSVYLGRVVADGSPVLVPRDVFREHAHGLGDSGSGKTSLFLCPLIEQLAAGGECSVVTVNLKADSSELLATHEAIAEAIMRRLGLILPVKYFSNQTDRSTFAFNPMKQQYWSKFDLLTRTDILCAANGLTYGTDYGQGCFSSANAAILYHALKTFPHVTTFVELADCIGEVTTTAKKRDLHPEIRKAGVHVHEVIKRLAACEALNVTSTSGKPADVIENAIDLTDVFRTPQLLYFHLSSTLSPSGAPEIARLVTYMLLAAATQTERKHPVFLVIDEFQRMVASNLEYMLQLARSMGVGVILANQSMEDLKKSTTNLIPAIEANCRLRQWFSVSSSDDQQRLINSSGVTIDHALGVSKSTNPDGRSTVTYSQTEQVVSRFTQNDVLLTSDHPFRSFLRISRGAGYAQYGGLPVIIESSFHISAEEYRRRQALPWPNAVGSFRPRQVGDESATDSSVKPPMKAAGPKWTEEVIGDDRATSLPEAELGDIDDLFRQFQQTLPQDGSRRKGKQP